MTFCIFAIDKSIFYYGVGVGTENITKRIYITLVGDVRGVCGLAMGQFAVARALCQHPSGNASPPFGIFQGWVGIEAAWAKR